MNQIPGLDDDDDRAGPYDQPFELPEYEQGALDLDVEQLPARRGGPHDVA